MTIVEFNDQLVGLEQKLNSFALKLTSDKDDAMDLLQETFLKAMTCRKQFEETSNLKAWTYTIMKNTFINNYRKKVLRKTTFDHTKDLFFLNQNKDVFHTDPESAYNEKEINKEIDRLNSKLRIPFRMYMCGYKYDEIAQTLGIKVGTVKSRIFFTRKRLSGILRYN
ncbi:MAG: RNA polymerase sigma factor [Tannerella sp.]|jgi:RNA polymerase sigma-70 factor (ECF subfamily)|nr:RNA polymerase sigma factor [Tannerella sp.]